MRIEDAQRQAVRLFVVHGDENLARLDGVRQHGPRPEMPPLRFDQDFLMGPDRKCPGIAGVDSRRTHVRDTASAARPIAGSGFACATAKRCRVRSKAEREIWNSARSGIGDRLIKQKPRPAVGMIETAVGEQPAFRCEIRLALAGQGH